ncbi:MAG: MATE family efflux transporter [Clostridia bacterium]|nr:MATE family efflux transporter [Clostridia bacterium]
MKYDKHGYRDLTTGSIWKKLVLFALPLLLSSLVQQLYNTVDLIFAGNLIDSNASAAIGMSGMLITCLVGFFGGMSVGAGVLIARSYGNEDYDGLHRAIHSTVALCAIGSILLLVLGEVLTPVYLRLVHTPEGLWPMAMGYLRIYFISMPAIIFYNLCSGMLRSLGDSRSTLVAQVAGGLFNVLADWLFIARLHCGVAGAAWATLISQTISAAYVVYRLKKLDGPYALKLRQVRLDRGVLRETLRIGVPAGVQSLVITLSNVFVQYHINRLGGSAIAAFTAYFKIELIVYYPIMALGQAMMTFVGQNMGASKPERVRRGLWECLGLGVGVSLLLSVLGLVGGRLLFSAFYSDGAAIALGLRIIATTFPFYFIYCFLEIPGDALRGMGESRLPMLIVIVNLCLLRTALLFLIVPRWPDVRGIAVCYLITWAMTGACMLVCWLKRSSRIKPAG